ncbi:MAG: hypothetical protein ACI86C_001235 [Candidatus Latescibacterota bacterium]
MRSQNKEMKKTYFLGLLALALVIASCKTDEDDTQTITVQLLDRVDEAENAEEDIVEFLETHYYNYDEFTNPPEGFDFRIVIKPIIDSTFADRIPLINQVSVKQVPDRIEDGLMYNLYFLNVVQGEGDAVRHPDQVSVSYAGYNMLDNQVFDSSVSPVDFDLTQVVDGFQDGLVEFNTSTGFEINPDGTIEFQQYGIGAVFIPSGLGYFETAPRDINNNTLIESYSNIYFTFRVYLTEELDHDNDTVPSYVEDVNGNGIEEDDDTDDDASPNFFDVDDDGDGIFTRDEVVVESDGSITYTDTDGDGTPDYLDPDN